MKIIKISSKLKDVNPKYSIKLNDFTRLDYAISAYKLKETIPALKMFIKRLEVLERDNATKLILNAAGNLETHHNYILLKVDKKNADIIFFYKLDKLNWEILCGAYILFNSFSKQRDKLYEDYLEYVKIERIEQAQYQKKLQEFKRELATGNYDNGITFFNHKKFHNVLRKNKIKLFNVVYDDEIGASILTFKDVKIGDEEKGIIKYEKIILYIQNWSIIRYKLVFSDFIYDTKDVELAKIILHPYLKLMSLYPLHDWIKLGDYESFGLFLFSIVTAYDTKEIVEGIMPLADIIKNYFDLRFLWSQKKIKPKGIEEKLSHISITKKGGI